MRKLRKGDKVQVIAGKDKGAITTIIKVDEERIYLDGLNIVKRAVKGQGFIEKHLPIHISNVMYYCEKCKKPVRLGIKLNDKGKKIRYCKKCESEIK